jgi:regulatory protein YycH of two-component signal transduction system YycFG
MGMKYVEHVKSALLLLLVGLSVILTFSIWTYTPPFDTIQQAPAVDISIAESKRLDDVVKPYKILLSFDNRLTGTSSSFEMDRVMGIMKEWELREFSLVKNNLSPVEINEYSRAENRYTLFYPTDIPFPVFDNILPFSNTNLPQAGFDRMIVDSGRTQAEDLTIYFVSTSTKQLYTAKASKVGNQQFENKILKPAVEFFDYAEIQRNEQLSLYVSSEELEFIRYTYILEKIPPNRFRDALFDNPNKVRRSSIGAYNDEYSDDTALMNVDLLDHTLKYSYPAAETSVTGIPSELVFDSLDFVNEHKGWTDDFRFVGLDAIDQKVEYQLFLLGYPVFSDMSSTLITTNWGNNHVYQYLRPYYTLDLSLPSETEVSILPSGIHAVEMLQQVKNLNFSSVKELNMGYYLTRDDEKSLLNLEPSWFYLSDGVWNRLSPDTLGGGEYGLE